MSIYVAWKSPEHSLDLCAVEEDICDVGVHVLDVTPLPIAETVPKVVMAEDEHVVIGKDLGQLAVPLQVLGVPVGDEDQGLQGG